MDDRLERRDQFPFGRRGARSQAQPVGRRTMGVARSVFQKIVAHHNGMDQRVVGVIAGAHQPHGFARHAWQVDIGDARFPGPASARALCASAGGSERSSKSARLPRTADSAAPDRVPPGPLPCSNRISSCASCMSARSPGPGCPRSADSLHAGSDWRWRTSRPHGRPAAPACRPGGSPCGRRPPHLCAIRPVAVSIVASMGRQISKVQAFQINARVLFFASEL